MKKNIAIEIDDHVTLKVMAAQKNLTLSEVITEILKKVK
tara:strand:- start:2128 stop:2244 length:117 start_codon:yes stop_codon:yes gene_type:complete